MGQGSNGLVEEQGELAELKALLQRSTLFAETNPHIHVVPSTANPGIAMFFSYGLVAISLTAIFAGWIEGSAIQSVYAYSFWFAGGSMVIGAILEYQRKNVFATTMGLTFGWFFIGFAFEGFMVSWGLWQPSPAGTQITMAVWGVLAFVFFLQSLVANFVLSLLFITTAILFWCVAAQQSYPSAVKGTGWFGFFVGCLSIYAGTAVFFIETYGREILPLGAYNWESVKKRGVKFGPIGTKRFANERSAQEAAFGSAVGSSDTLVTFEEVQQIARSRGLEISLKTLGPAYRIVCRDAAASNSSSSNSGGSTQRRRSSAELAAEEAAAGVGGSGRVLAVTSGFLVPPLRLMHCDTLQVFTRGLRGEEGSRARGGVLGLGLLMGAATFAFGLAAGCTKAEILAINDDDAWHERLVSYYSRFGFKPVRVVGGSSFADLPHMLVWGGAGTRMDADVEGMLRRWSTAVRRNTAAAATGALCPGLCPFMDEQKPIVMDQAGLVQLIASGTAAQQQMMQAVQTIVETMKPLVENLQEERHQQRAFTQQLFADSQQTREELRQNRELQQKLLEALQARQAPAQLAPSQADNTQGAAGLMPAPAASGGAMHAPAAGGAAAAGGATAAEEDGAAVVLPGEGIVKYRLKSHVFSHYVDGQLYREPRLHLHTLRCLTPKLAAMKKSGGKVSWKILKEAGIPFEQWPVMLSKRGDRNWMTVSQARKIANI